MDEQVSFNTISWLEWFLLVSLCLRGVLFVFKRSFFGSAFGFAVVSVSRGRVLPDTHLTAKPHAFT